MNFIPATLIIDKCGAVIDKYVGMTDYSSDEFLEKLRALANE